MQTSIAGREVVTLPGGAVRSYSVTTDRSAREDVQRFLRQENATVLSERVFGAVAEPGKFWPVTALPGDGVPFVQFSAVSGAAVRPVECGGRNIGAVYEDDGITYCVLGDLRPADLTASRCDQARSVLEQLEAALKTAGMGIEHVVRTWFFIDRILDWYGEFNCVRTSMFEKWGLFERVLPASTGIGTPNTAGAALVLEAIAMKSADETVEVEDVVSPLQCPATSYRSSFSRAVEVTVPGRRSLYVSGTASIAPDGHSAHTGDLDRQIALTMNVVQQILCSRGMHWSDVTRGVAYFREVSKTAALERHCRTHGLPDLPVAIASADICRDDLLFELEVDAVVPE